MDVIKTVVIRHANGNVKKRYTLKNGRIDGKVSSFWENGAPKSLVTFVEGFPRGNIKEWDANSKLKRVYKA